MRVCGRKRIREHGTNGVGKELDSRLRGNERSLRSTPGVQLLPNRQGHQQIAGRAGSAEHHDATLLGTRKTKDRHSGLPWLSRPLVAWEARAVRDGNHVSVEIRSVTRSRPERCRKTRS